MISLHEVGIVGGGFVGAFAAWKLAQKGISVALFEEHPSFGVPPHCAGLVSIRGLERLGIYNLLKNESIIQNYIDSAKLITYQGKVFPIKLDAPIAVVLDRVALDKKIAEKAVESGVEARLSTKVLSIDPSGTLIARKKYSSKEHYSFHIIVDAEGASRNLIRNLPGVHLHGLLPAMQVDIKIGYQPQKLSSSTVLVHFIVPDFFAWLIPLDETGKFWRVGLATRKYSKFMQSIIRNLIRKYFKKASIRSRFGGLVVSGGPIRKFSWGKILAVGDAAGQVKPTTGGGVIFGGLSAGIVSEVIYLYLNFDTPLSLYEIVWKKIFRSNMQIMLATRKVYNLMTHLGIDKISRFLPSNILVNLRGDFDFQLEGILRMISSIFLFK